ncbi:alkyl sulfatase dimerization domain-containing protein, partial [Vibrio anguillarum]
YFPKHRVLMASEVMTHTIHNISTLRGARTRDANAWAAYVDESLEMFTAKSDVMIGSHHWPTWGTNNITEQLEKTRDMYKFVHDQTLRLANQGYTPNEISASIALPESLDKAWYNRGYYGTVSHNARATYDFY